MIRAAAKNHAHVAVVVDPEDYGPLIAALDAHDGGTPYALRQRAGTDGLCAHGSL
jgi:phosphoribosylaminoimidazolecarboxamide formyltransferase/IMP cyclohydrolase